MWDIFKKRRTILALTLTLCLSLIAAGTFAWFTLVQNLTNEFVREPYDVKLIKVSAADPDLRLAGAEFGLYDENGNELCRYVTDENGEIMLDTLDPDRTYYFQELLAPYGFQIKGDGKTALFRPDMQEIVVENDPIPSTLSIVKKLGGTDLNGDPYTPTKEDLAFPFAFTVTIGEGSGREYGYTITDGAGMKIAPYTYRFEDGTTIHQPGDGVLHSGETLYLRDGETAVVNGVPTGTAYQVRERRYLSYEDPDFAEKNAFDNPGGYGCEDETTPGHDRVLTTASGWAGFGYNTSGTVREEGSVAVLENKRVPKDYAVTISSLAVVDRILANPEDVDYGKGFQITVEIGEESDNLAYYYEVVHLPDTAEALGTPSAGADYYDRNDPGVPGQLDPQPDTPPGPDHFYEYSLAPPAKGEAPGALTSSDRWTLPKIPETYAAPAMWLHHPTDGERWPQQDGTYGSLLLSGDSADNPLGTHNKIVAELHHGSALIIYGIPVGTAYTVSQKDYRYVDGYLIDSTNKDAGVILPDLDVREDPDTADPSLLRVRADIYNYFVLPVMRKVTVEKTWEHGDNDPAFYPASTKIDIYDPETHYVYDSRSYRPIQEWVELEVPKYRPGTHELIHYAVGEDPPPDYVIGGIEETEDGFKITNTYAPCTVKPSVQKRVLGSDYPAADFYFELKALTQGAPMPMDTATTVVHGVGTGFFGGIRFEPTGVDGTRTYLYEIREVPGTAVGYTYDGTVYRLKVTVEEQGGKVRLADTTYTNKKTGAPASAPLPFVNRYEDVPRASLTVKKTVAGQGADRSKQFSFRVDIDGYPTQYLQLRGGEKATIAGIPVGTRYTVTEDGYYDEGYTTTSTGSAGTIPSGGATAAFTNAFSPSQPGLGRLTLTKRVEGAGAETGRQFRFVVRIGSDRQVVYLRDGETWTSQPYTAGTAYSVTEDSYTDQGYVTTSTGASGTISVKGSAAAFVNRKDETQVSSLTVTKRVEGTGAEPNWRFSFTVSIGGNVFRIGLAGGERYTFYDIPVGTAYSVVEDDYTAEGYVTTSSGGAGTIPAQGATASFLNRKGEPVTPGETGRLSVTKTVTGTFVDATKEFRFTLTLGGAPQEFFLRHGESKSFESIPAGTPYSVVEDDYAAEGYATTSAGAAGTMTAAGATAAFVNEYGGGTPPPPAEGAVQISGVKTWVHGTSTPSEQPKSIEVFIMDGSTIVARKTVTAADNWSYAFNLPRYDREGREIVYSVNEEPVKGYSKSVQGYDLTNTYAPGAPQTGGPSRIWVWFLWLAVGAVGLRCAVFYKRKGRPSI